MSRGLESSVRQKQNPRSLCTPTAKEYVGGLFLSELPREFWRTAHCSPASALPDDASPSYPRANGRGNRNRNVSWWRPEKLGWYLKKMDISATSSTDCALKVYPNPQGESNQHNVPKISSFTCSEMRSFSYITLKYTNSNTYLIYDSNDSFLYRMNVLAPLHLFKICKNKWPSIISPALSIALHGLT